MQRGMTHSSDRVCKYVDDCHLPGILIADDEAEAVEKRCSLELGRESFEGIDGTEDEAQPMVRRDGFGDNANGDEVGDTSLLGEVNRDKHYNLKSWEGEVRKFIGG